MKSIELIIFTTYDRSVEENLVLILYCLPTL